MNTAAEFAAETEIPKGLRFRRPEIGPKTAISAFSANRDRDQNRDPLSPDLETSC